MTSTPLVSVVTPFYNTQEYLGECIESVLRQTYDNWEYVLVDNQSVDGSSEIAGEYVARFPGKIRVVRTESFLSQVQNYNFALSQISPHSKYVKMVQADDWIFPDCVRAMVEIAEAHPNVGIVGAYELDGEKVRMDGLPYPSPEVSGRRACRLYFLKNLYLFGSPTGLLFRSELLRSRNPFFDERYAPFEDSHVCFDMLKTWNFGFVHQVLTFTRRENVSLMTGVLTFGLLPVMRFSILVAHGRYFLSEDEYRLCFKKVERDYFIFLSKAACARRQESQKFWEYHRRVLASVGYSLGWQLLAKWVPRAIFEKSWEAFCRARKKTIA